MSNKEVMNMFYDEFIQNGYIVLPSVLTEDQCKTILDEEILPFLEQNDFFEHDESSWHDKQMFEWGDECGAVVSNEGSSPISYERSSWVLNNRNIVVFLNLIHGGMNWEYTGCAGNEQSLGWIHMRFPYVDKSDKWEPPIPTDGWHVDGDPTSVYTKNSVVMLPFITDVNPGGGGTAVIPGSHKRMYGFMHGRSELSVSQKMRGFIRSTASQSMYPVPSYLNGSKATEVTGKAGSVLIMHPLLIHSSSNVCNTQPMRYTFNIATQWRT